MTISQALAKKFGELAILKFRVRSKSEPGKYHIVEMFADKHLECDCPASCFRKIECRHIRIVKEKLYQKCQIPKN